MALLYHILFSANPICLLVPLKCQKVSYHLQPAYCAKFLLALRFLYKVYNAYLIPLHILFRTPEAILRFI